MATRSPKSTVKPTLTEEQVRVNNAEAMARMSASFDAEDIASPFFGKRVLIASVAWLLTYATSFYWGYNVALWLTAATYLLTTSVFLAYLVAFVMAVAAFISALIAAGHVGKFILTFDTAKAVDTGRDLRIAAARKVSLVRSWFTPASTETPMH